MKSVVILITCFTAVLFAAGVVIGATAHDNQSKSPKKDKISEKALFAGGCFWCLEKPFEILDGVISVISGYAGGTTANPTYQDYGDGGHIEVVQITYDPEAISYARLLDVFWRQIDPTDGGGQFVDRGHGYISAIFYYDDNQKQMAEDSKRHLAASGIFTKPLVTPIEPAPRFWPAEDYHQDYYKKNPLRYNYYRSGSGRDNFLRRYWQDKELPEAKGATASPRSSTK